MACDSDREKLINFFIYMGGSLLLLIIVFGFVALVAYFISRD